MKTLMLLRHAKSSWADPERSDHDRPLNKRGRNDAPRMGLLIREHDLVPDLIVSSTARRARKTAVKVMEACGCDAPLERTDDIYHASADMLLELVRSLPAERQRVMLVGHNPGLEDLLELLTGTWEQLPTAALALVGLQVDRWTDVQEGCGCLQRLWRPRELA